MGELMLSCCTAEWSDEVPAELVESKSPLIETDKFVLSMFFSNISVASNYFSFDGTRLVIILAKLPQLFIDCFWSVSSTHQLNTRNCHSSLNVLSIITALLLLLLLFSNIFILIYIIYQQFVSFFFIIFKYNFWIFLLSFKKSVVLFLFIFHQYLFYYIY